MIRDLELPIMISEIMPLTCTYPEYEYVVD